VAYEIVKLTWYGGLQRSFRVYKLAYNYILISVTKYNAYFSLDWNHTVWHLFASTRKFKHRVSLKCAFYLHVSFLCLFILAQQSPVGQDFLIHEVSRSNDAPQPVGLLWMSDQLLAETSTRQNTTLTRDKHSCFRLESNPQSQRPQTYALYRAVTGSGSFFMIGTAVLRVVIREQGRSL
jgi:hypothetical protein